MPILPNIVSVAEAARELKRSRQRVYKLIEDGQIETARFMGHIVIETKEIVRFKKLERPNGRPKNGKVRGSKSKVKK